MTAQPRKPLTPVNYTLRVGNFKGLEVVDLWHGEIRVTLETDSGSQTTWVEHKDIEKLRDFLNDVIVSNLWRYPALGDEA